MLLKICNNYLSVKPQVKAIRTIFERKNEYLCDSIVHV